MLIPSITLSPHVRRALAMALGAVALASDALHILASRFRAPRTIDTIARDFEARWREVEGRDPPAWLAAARDLTTPPNARGGEA